MSTNHKDRLDPTKVETIFLPTYQTEDGEDVEPRFYYDEANKLIGMKARKGTNTVWSKKKHWKVGELEDIIKECLDEGVQLEEREDVSEVISDALSKFGINKSAEEIRKEE